MEGALDRAARGEPLSDEAAVHLAAAGPAALPAMLAAAAAARDRSFGRRVTFSPKVFLPLTNLCRNRCDYCSFRRSPGDGGEWTMTPAELEDWIGRAAEQGCGEALFCLGDKPEKAFGTYRRTLASFGHAGTVDYLVQGAELALRHGLLPHTNAGLLTHDDLRRLRRVNVSLGLMLECSSPRLCEPGMPHHRAPDKRPDRRLAMIADAGALKIPFTTGILIGIGETRQERAESLLAIRRLHRAHGHVQEVIVQSFRAVAGTPMAQSAEPDPAELLHAVALARLVLDPEVSLQAPPNLSPAGIAPLLGAGLNDFGGISPVTPDYINPRHPWPHLDALGETCAREGFELRPRMPVYDAYLGRAGWVEDELRPAARAVQARLGAVTQPSELARATKRAPLAHPRGARELAP